MDSEEKVINLFIDFKLGKKGLCTCQLVLRYIYYCKEWDSKQLI